MLRLLIIGIDGGSWRLLEQFIAAGVTPSLARLAERGVHGRLESTIPPLTPAAWLTMMTGRDPGGHGVFDFEKLTADERITALSSAADSRAPTLWRYLRETGYSIGFFNVPMTYPPPKEAAFVIPWFVPAALPSSWLPTGIKDELVRAIGPGPPTRDLYRGRTLDRARVHEAARYHVAAGDFLLGSRAVDAYMTVFSLIDRVCHAGWQAGQSRRDSDSPSGVMVEDAYRWVDAAIGRMISRWTDSETLVVVLSDHGFQPLDGAVYVNRLLMELGYLRTHGRAGRGGGRAPLLLKAYSAAKQTLKRVLPFSVSTRLAFRMMYWRRKMDVAQRWSRVNWERTGAFAWGDMGYVQVNLAGRQPLGSVGIAEYEAVRGDLVTDLAAARVPDTGEPVFESVRRGEEVWPVASPFAGPDIVPIPAGWRFAMRANLDLEYQPHVEDFPCGWFARYDGSRGTHAQDGLLVMAGPGVRSGEQIAGARLVDITPTILHLLTGIVPAALDGSVLADAVEKSLGGVVRVGEPNQPGAPPQSYTSEQEEQVRARLRRLGYLE